MQELDTQNRRQKRINIYMLGLKCIKYIWYDASLQSSSSVFPSPYKEKCYVPIFPLFAKIVIYKFFYDILQQLITKCFMNKYL